MAKGLGRREWMRLALALVVVVAVMQALPVGGGRSNPPARAEPRWDSPRTAALFARTCADCHSNRTRWPWYAYVAPVSWLVVSDVRHGREHFNVSEWDRPQDDAHEAAEMVREGKMPLRGYLFAHPEARLTDDERRALIAGLAATFGEEDEREDEERRRDDR
jgi:mono/diheme cytochrome c family protein